MPVGARFTPLAFSLLMLLTATPSRAAGGPTAGEIAARVLEHGTVNFVELKAELTLTTRRKGEEPKIRGLSLASKRIDERLHTLVRFRSPAEVAGIALLAIEGRGGKPDELTLYLPAYKRTRRIAPGQRGAAFADTDFSYADFSQGGQSVDPASARRLDDARLLERDVYVVEGPAPTESPYARVKAWIDRETWLPLKVESSGKDGVPAKTYTVLELAKQGGRTLPKRASMATHKTDSETELVLDKVETDSLPAAAFTERALERG